LTGSRGAFALTAAGLVLAATAGGAVGARGAGEPSAASRIESGKKLYRKYCGQCHALGAARAVGFGSNRGLGKDGGPSFNNLRVPYTLSVSLMMQASNGHERIVHRLKFAQIRDVATYLAAATKNHTHLAQATDG
jgi:mono/diheme cytochrome c family protein